MPGYITVVAIYAWPTPSGWMLTELNEGRTAGDGRTCSGVGAAVGQPNAVRATESNLKVLCAIERKLAVNSLTGKPMLNSYPQEQ